MGNHILRNGGGNKAKIMKTNGELFKLKTPAQAKDIIKDYPGYVLLDSDEFVRFNLRAKPLSPEAQLLPNKIYLLVQLPRFPAPSNNYQRKSIRRTQSDGQSNYALDRLESLMFRRRRSLSDLPETDSRNDHASPRRAMSLPGSPRSPGRRGPVRFKMRLPKALVERIKEESKDKAEMAKRILDLFMEEGEAAAAAGGEGMAAQSSTVMLPTVEEESDGIKKSNNKVDKDLACKYCIDFHSLCSPYTTSHSKYGRLTHE